MSKLWQNWTMEMLTTHSKIDKDEDQPPPQALRFSHGRGERETSDW